MIFMCKKTGELCELFIKSLGENIIRMPSGHLFPVGEIAMVGNIDEQTMKNGDLTENFIFMGLL